MIGKIAYWTNIFNCILHDNSGHLWTEIIFSQMKECKSINFVHKALYNIEKFSDRNSTILEIKLIFIQRLIFTKYPEILKVSVFLWACYAYCKNNEIQVIDIKADINISRLKGGFSFPKQLTVTELNCNFIYKYTRVGTRLFEEIKKSRILGERLYYTRVYLWREVKSHTRKFRDHTIHVESLCFPSKQPSWVWR